MQMGKAGLSVEVTCELEGRISPRQKATCAKALRQEPGWLGWNWRPTGPFVRLQLWVA